MSIFEILVIAGAILTAVLFLYACVLAFKLKQRQKRRSQPQVFEPKSQSKMDAQQSIRVIAQALLQNDLSSTEAAMRIGFLAQQFSPEKHQAKPLEAFQALAMDTSHLPILDAWQALSPTEKTRLEKERLSIEKNHAQAVNSAAEVLAKCS